MRFPDRLAILHPLWFLAVLIAVFVAAPMASMAPAGPSVGLILAISCGGVMLPLLWAHGIYNVASQTGARRSGQIVFLVVETAIVLGFILGFMSGDEGPSGSLSAFFALPVLGYFVCLWLAARALVRAESSVRDAEFATTLGTFLLAVYWMIGAWLIRPRVRRLLEKREINPSSA